MKKSIELIGLPVLSINEGLEYGTIEKLVINTTDGSIEGLVLSKRKWYEAAKILPFNSIIGIGENAIIIESENVIKSATCDSSYPQLLDADIQIVGTKVFTRHGEAIGTITEILIDLATGRIDHCELHTTSGSTATVLASNIINYGTNITFIDEASSSIAKETTTALPITEQKLDIAVTNAKDNPLNKKFDEINMKYILGKKSTCRITADSGSIVVEQGDVITEEVLQKAKLAGKFVELSMNVQ